MLTEAIPVVASLGPIPTPEQQAEWAHDGELIECPNCELRQVRVIARMYGERCMTCRHPLDSEKTPECKPTP